MSAINELYAVDTHLSGGLPDGTAGDQIERIKNDCGWIISGIDWVITKFWQPGLRVAIIQKLAGDFVGLEQMKFAWGNVALALDEIGLNYDGLGKQLPAVWEGDASRAAIDQMTTIGTNHADQAEAARLMQDELANLIDVSMAVAEVVAAGLHLINDIAQELISDAAVPVVGWGKALITGAGKVKRIISTINRVLDAIERIKTALHAALRILTVFNAAMAGLNTVLSAIDTGTAAHAGSHIDDTADAGFGTS